ncbi:hypothetical protein FQA39_LY09651 [Lamprigera yunnana]|nr:hypothetical protein FQA39_LY09651 [Lamprigera yunnana]
MSNLLMKLKTSPSCSKRRCNEKISDGPSIEDEILKKNSDCTDTISKEAKINYQDELVLLFFNSMLDIIVSSWVSTQTVIGPTCVCKKVGTRKIEESFSSFTDGEAVNSDINDTKRSRSSATSVKSSVLDGKRDSIKRKLSKISELSISAESWSKQSKDTRPSFESKQSSDVVPDWILCVPDEKVIVKFKNGDYYEGATRRKLMHGYGKYTWSDGTVYEGDFVNGYASGHGVLRYSDLSIYHGEFCKSILNGYGEFNIAESTMKYCGMWKSGQKHGKGWMLYCPKSWYDGEWCEDQRHGKGLRYYEGGEKYQGDWCNGERHGNGIFVWNNNDIYKGKWVEGKINGYGEYTWNAFLNKTFTFPIENVYKGLWVNGVRHGTGILDFGFDNGAKVACVFENNCKHGAGILICGNGAIVQQSVLFWNDTPINILKTATSNRSESCNNVQVGGNILRIPIHAPPEETDFSYYIDFAIREYLGFLYKEQLNNIEPGQRLGKENTLDTPGAYIQQNNTTVSVERCPSTNTAEYNNMLAVFKLQQREVEKKHVRDALIYELPKLYKLYNKYATITSYQKVAFTPILIRYFFWQMIRDLNFLGTKYTLVDIDMIILENPNCGLEFDHHPFERIYFWQFLQILMTLAWKLHSPCIVVEDCKTYGALATIFHNFLAEAVYSYPEITHCNNFLF